MSVDCSNIVSTGVQMHWENYYESIYEWNESINPFFTKSLEHLASKSKEPQPNN